MSAPAQTAPEEVRNAIARTNELFCTELVRNRNADAIAQLYTADARILPPGAPMISGREGIQSYWSEAIRSLNPSSAVLEPLDVIAAGEDVIELGRAVIQADPQGTGTVTIEGKYVVCWRREDGRWKLHIDIWNLNA